MGLDVRYLSSGFANNKGADQPEHPCRLISTFVTFLEGIIFTLITGETSTFQLDM